MLITRESVSDWTCVERVVYLWNEPPSIHHIAFVVVLTHMKCFVTMLIFIFLWQFSA